MSTNQSEQMPDQPEKNVGHKQQFEPQVGLADDNTGPACNSISLSLSLSAPTLLMLALSPNK